MARAWKTAELQWAAELWRVVETCHETEPCTVAVPWQPADLHQPPRAVVLPCAAVLGGHPIATLRCCARPNHPIAVPKMLCQPNHAATLGRHPTATLQCHGGPGTVPLPAPSTPAQLPKQLLLELHTLLIAMGTLWLPLPEADGLAAKLCLWPCLCWPHPLAAALHGQAPRRLPMDAK